MEATSNGVSSTASTHFTG